MTNDQPFSRAELQEAGSSRRRFLKAALAAPAFALTGVVGELAAETAVERQGEISPPAAVPEVRVVCHDGAARTLPELLHGHATAVQLMFTSCISTCPMAAAIFQRVQSRIPDMAQRNMQLLSLSVEPKVDTPKALAAWLRRFHAGPSWIAAVSDISDGRVIRSFFGDGKISGDHSSQVSIIDRQGRMVWRTFALPQAEEIIAALQKI